MLNPEIAANFQDPTYPGGNVYPGLINTQFLSGFQIMIFPFIKKRHSQLYSKVEVYHLVIKRDNGTSHSMDV